MPLCFPDEDDCVAFALERGRRHSPDIHNQTDGADRGRRQNRLAIGLVVERAVSRHDGEVERPADFRDAVDAGRDLAHDVGFSGLPKLRLSVMASGPRAGCGEIAPRFRDGLFRAFEGICAAIARRHIGGDGERLVGAMHANDGRISAGRLHRVGHHAPVILLPDPSPRTEIGRTNEFHERFDERLGAVESRLFRNRRALLERPLIDWRFFGERVHGNVGDGLAFVTHHEPLVSVVVPMTAKSSSHFLKMRSASASRLASARQACVLRFGQQHLVGGHLLFALPARDRDRARCRATPSTPSRRMTR